MLKRIRLRYIIFSFLFALVLVNILGALISLMYTYRTQNMYSHMVDRDINALIAAQKLEKSLIMQKGLLTYYFLTEDINWLKQLDAYHQEFEKWIKTARLITYQDKPRAVLNDIEAQYVRYVVSRDDVVSLYKNGDKKKGSEKHWQVRDQFFNIFEQCETYKTIHETNISNVQKKYHREGRFITLLIYIAMPLAVLLGLFLALIIFRQILDPIRNLVFEVDNKSNNQLLSNEVAAIGQRIHQLMDNMDQTQNKLEKSKKHLIQSEKMAMVGKLAAGVAHSIRNPLTSVKMRLFSLQRNLVLSSVQKEDFEVISDEISQIDTIVRNFLEFSRRPKLKYSQTSPSDVVDMTLVLLTHRIESYNVSVEIDRVDKLPAIWIDTDQIKEVLVNIILNACDAIGSGGKIIIQEKMENTVNGNTLIIRIIDNGLGIPETISEKIFEPFFSTKTEGSGLGLSIARSIIEAHDGYITIESKEGRGSAVEITLPYRI